MSPGRLDLHGSLGAFQLDLRCSWSGRQLNLFGPSGSGKSTVLEAIAGVRSEVEGRIDIAGRTLQGGEGTLRSERRGVGWAPQDAALFPHLSVRRNIAYGRRRAWDPEVEDLAVDALALGGLLERSVGGLSGGERQRVALARALASGAHILLLDEPTSSLDIHLRRRLLRLISHFRDRRETEVIFVSHDPREVRALGGAVAVLDAGRLVSFGAPDEVFASPPGIAAMEAAGVENRFDVEVVDTRRDVTILRSHGGTCLVMATVPRGRMSLQGTVRVRAEDVIVATHPVQSTSARNVIEGTVLTVEPTGQVAYMRIQTGRDLWIARVTPQAVSSLEIEAGTRIWLVIKAQAVHPVIDPGASPPPAPERP